jgi:hypothetical protein
MTLSIPDDTLCDNLARDRFGGAGAGHAAARRSAGCRCAESGQPPSGCRVRTRCWKVQDVCAVDEPELIVRESLDHPSACHFAAIRQVIETHDVS